MKLYIIDSKHWEIRQKDLEEDHCVLAEMQEAVGGLIDTAFVLGNGDTFFVDDEGLLKTVMLKNWFVVKGAHQPFAGNGVVAGTDDSGESVSPLSSIEEIRNIVRFVDATTVKLLIQLDEGAAVQLLKNLFEAPQEKRLA